MSASPSKMHHPSSRSGMPAFGAFPANKASMLIEKTPGLRRSTPDSEALASSDDEVEQTRAAQQALNSKVAKAARRTSWLNELPPPNRRLSNTMSGPYSPSNSNPATPNTDQQPWTSTASPGLTGSGTWNTSSSYPWGTIWNNENRKEPPSRLQEVLPSPTAINPPTAKFLADEYQNHASHRGAAEGPIPFTIPLQPTPKTYRSQSYSVGQLDTGAVIPSILKAASPNEAGRSRFIAPYPPLQRRSSRPGAMNDRQDSGGLDRVREVDDDEEHGRDQHGKVITTAQAQMIERLEKENAALRQAAQGREKTASSSVAANISSSAFRNTRIRGAVPEETDLAVDDGEEINSVDFRSRNTTLRRLSEQIKPYTDEEHPLSAMDNRNLESFKKAQWQTSLGFGSVMEPPQSRRHSFADVPTRHGSFSTEDRDEDSRSYENMAQDFPQGNDRELPLPGVPQPSESQLRNEFSRNRRHAVDYFVSTESTRHEAEEKVQRAFAASNPYGRYVGVSNLGPAAQPLYIVNFKCCRSDVFYIQEGTGLQVNPGDLVIVEADRGTDLGSVQHANVTWEQAKKFKEHYAEEHYKWLMMFSQQARNGGPNAVNPNGLQHGLHGAPGSAVGGMGPQGHHGSHESSHTELKPKMIKRLAQNHEIQALQEKEGNEAKAKRVCQQRVAEHRLNMEILDAEFQMDSKKLTFYYFADAYINFNSLVTDLFKIYKTRIWMSAINPASFVTPTASLGPVPAFGGAVIGAGRVSPAGRRRQHVQGYAQQSSKTFDEPYGNDRSQLPQTGAMRDQYINTYPYAPAAQQGAYGMQGYPQSTVDPFAPYNPYHMLNPTAPNFASSQGQDGRNRGSNQPGANNWLGRFQDLTLNGS